MTPGQSHAWHSTSYAELHALAAEHGTPFYLYDADLVAARIGAVRRATEGRFGVYYAVKANPNLALLRALRGVADGLDISSKGELDQARLAGFAPAALSFAGPGKSDAELSAAIEAGVGCISIESMRELAACATLARDAGTRASILVRVNPLLASRPFGIKMAGKPIQFGIDEEALPDAMATIVREAGALAFRGIHVYAGSQCFDAPGLVEGVANSLRIARDMEARFGVACDVVNLGGGFGVAHTAGDREFDLMAAAQPLLEARRRDREACGRDRRVLFELGRYLVADAGVYVTRVVSTKASRGARFVIADGGLNHHLAAAGTFGAALRGTFPLLNLTRPEAMPARCSIAGPSCNPTDLLGIDVELAAPQEGDLIAVLKSGSYGFTASPLLFLGRETPAELIRHNGVIAVGRRRRTMTDFN
jgi:diaminopimelate decarboxylase